jgi:hypothetical protein
MAVLRNLKADNERLERELAEAKALVASALEAKAKGLTMKVAKSGGVSVYGMSRWPTTLYRSQWERLLAEKETILAFIEANADRLSVKE